VKIILADDHDLFRDGCSMLLQHFEEGVTVLKASDLEEAMELASCHPNADVILLDLDMPGMKNGQEGIKRISEGYPQLPIVVLSACESKETIQASMAAGALGFIPKSSSTVVMQTALRLVLSGSVYLPAQILMADRVESAGHNGQHRLTDRQRDVLRLLVAGKSNKQICRELNLSEGTIKSHIAGIFHALDVNNRTEAANSARRLGLID
jgi:DNA-binding NarL/FixJ family response regulator